MAREDVGVPHPPPVVYAETAPEHPNVTRMCCGTCVDRIDCLQYCGFSLASLVKLYVDADGLVLQVGEGKGRERTAVNSTVASTLWSEESGPPPGCGVVVPPCPDRIPTVRCPSPHSLISAPPFFLVLTCILLASAS